MPRWNRGHRAPGRGRMEGSRSRMPPRPTAAFVAAVVAAVVAAIVTIAMEASPIRTDVIARAPVSVHVAGRLVVVDTVSLTFVRHASADTGIECYEREEPDRPLQPA